MGSQFVNKEKFSEFYGNWMRQLEDHLELLLKVAQENHLDKEIYEAAVNKLTSHHKEFYQVKWDNEDVLAFFTLVWLTPLVQANLWVTGWKSSMIFKLVESLRKTSLARMTEEQDKTLEALKLKIKADERKVESGMERQQMKIGDRNIVELMRLEISIKRINESVAMNRVNEFVEVTLKMLLATLKNMMKMADCVRLKILKGILDILNPEESAHFLTAMSKLQIQMRKMGNQIQMRKIERLESSSSINIL